MAVIQLVVPEKKFRKNMAKPCLEFLSVLRDGFQLAVLFVLRFRNGTLFTRKQSNTHCRPKHGGYCVTT
jgi:hypothetical protein